MNDDTLWLEYEIACQGPYTKGYIFGQQWTLESDSFIRDYVVDYYELWAREADTYRLRYKTNIIPPSEIIQQKIKELESRISCYQIQLELLKFQIFKQE